MINPKNLVRHELIGLRVSVAKAANPFSKGLSGRVVDETRNTLIIESNGRERSLAKDEHAFSFSLPSGEQVLVDGNILVGRPEDRIKKRLKSW